MISADEWLIFGIWKNQKDKSLTNLLTFCFSLISGRFGQVHKCMENSSGLTLAAKIIKARSQKEKVREKIVGQLEKEEGESEAFINATFVKLATLQQQCSGTEWSSEGESLVQQWRDNEWEDDSLLMYL